MSRLSEREAQARLANEGDETEPNPLTEAGDFPSRFQTLSYFFEAGEGVEIVQDLDWPEDEVKVYYFWEGGREEIKEGALYEWATEKWEE